jgi:sulfur relay (sulfurtransferase) complex TusBCD TusD component (DsrE family)
MTRNAFATCAARRGIVDVMSATSHATAHNLIPFWCDGCNALEFYCDTCGENLIDLEDN